MTVTDILFAMKTGYSNDMAALMMARQLKPSTEEETEAAE